MIRRRIMLDELPALLSSLEPEVGAAVLRGLSSAAVRAKGVVIEEIDRSTPYPAVDTGRLRNSVHVNAFTREIYIDAPHAAPINNGTRPFTPPLGPLLTWVIRKGLADDEDEAYAIARGVQQKIAREGIEPRHFWEKAMDRVQRDVVPLEIRTELGRLAERGHY